MAAGLAQRNARMREPSFWLRITLCVAALAAGCATGRRDNASESTIVGRWSIVSQGCAEQYEFRADGTFSSASRNERLDGRYSVQEIAGRPASAKVRRSIERDNLGMDCAGSSRDNTGTQDVRFIVLDASKNRMQVCGTDAATDCYGPLIRQVSPAVPTSFSSPTDVVDGAVPQQRTTEFVRVDLDRGVHVDVPGAWLSVDPKLRGAYMARRTASGGYVGLIARSELNTTSLLEVEASKATYGPRLLISSKSPPTVKTRTVVDANESDLRLFTSMVEKASRDMVASGGQQLLEVRPLQKTTLGGRPALFSEAIHTTKEGRNMVVRQYLVPTDEQELRFTFHVAVDDQKSLLPLIERVESSVTIDR